MTRITNIFPVFAVRNIEEARDYYQAKLGFTIRWSWGDPVSRLGVGLGDIEIQLEGEGMGAPSGPSVVYCHMTDVDSYYQECRKRGAIIHMELADRPWGIRDFRVCDPTGNRIGFGSPQ